MKRQGCFQETHLPFPQPEPFFLCLCAIKLSEGRLHCGGLPVEMQEISVPRYVECCTDIFLHFTVGQLLSVCAGEVAGIQLVPFNVYWFL